jgi:hypothetical protein
MGRLRRRFAVNDSSSIDSILSQITHLTLIKAPHQLILLKEYFFTLVYHWLKKVGNPNGLS